MATSTTPVTDSPRPRSASQSQSHSRTRSGAIPSRPTTPLRPPSRTSLRASQSTPTAGTLLGPGDTPLNALEPSFGELSDAMADLEANMLHLQLLNESLSRFNETFGAFLYGMNMSAFCVDFPEAPITQSFGRHKEPERGTAAGDNSMFPNRTMDAEATFLTTDTSFVENPPPTSSKPSSKFNSVPPSVASSRQTMGAGGRGYTGRGRAGGSGIARGTSTRGARGAAAGARGGSGIARGAGRGRGVR